MTSVWSCVCLWCVWVALTECRPPNCSVPVAGPPVSRCCVKRRWSSGWAADSCPGKGPDARVWIWSPPGSTGTSGSHLRTWRLASWLHRDKDRETFLQNQARINLVWSIFVVCTQRDVKPICKQQSVDISFLFISIFLWFHIIFFFLKILFLS